MTQEKSPVDAGVIYDAFAPHYKNYSKAKTNYLTAVNSLVLERFRSRVQRILDFGAGDGSRGSDLAQQLGAEYFVQADISENMLGLCREIGKANEYWDVRQPEWYQKPQRFDLIFSLWNVFGHIPTHQQRVDTLKILHQLTAKEGRLCLDVNNRHFIGYGKWKSKLRRLHDFLLPDWTRGDAHFLWEIDGVKYPATGHLFIFAELSELFRQSGWIIEEWRAVNYVTGAISKSLEKGQLFFILKKKEL